MNNQVINKLIAENKGDYGKTVLSGALTILPIPDNKGAVITEIRVKAFTDLPNGRNFDSLSDVIANSWHQLRVISSKGISVFSIRHKLISGKNAVGRDIYLPSGETIYHPFINCEKNVFFELSSFSKLAGSLTQTSAQVPNTSTPVYNPPPRGYGKVSQVGAVAVNETLRVNAGNIWEERAFNKFTPENVANNVSFTKFQWPINGDTQLNPPQPTIEFGCLTIPIIEVEYMLCNKDQNAFFGNPING